VFFALSKVLDVLLCPLTWAILLVFAATPFRPKPVRRWRRARWLSVAALSVLLLFSCETTELVMYRAIERCAEATYEPDVTYDAAVLLGGVTDERVMASHARPSYNGNVERLTETFRLLREGKARFAILSGAAVDASLASYGEAIVLAQQLREWGIEADRLIVEDRARNTYENAAYSADIARARGLRRIVVVTSAFHMARALECFAAVDLPVDALPVDHRTYAATYDAGMFLPRASALAGTTTSFHELFGWIIYRAKGYARSRR
jgi:uncharacterized SAM-binding protein YcdF (DUF218 family)